jgi:hypothetical protein
MITMKAGPLLGKAQCAFRPAEQPAAGLPRGRRGARGQTQAHASKRIRVEHGISHLKNWRALSRHLGRREHLDTILPAVAGLVSSQERALRPDRLRRPPKALLAGTVR